MEPADVLIVRPGLGSWIVREPWARVGPFALAGWWPPVVIPLVMSQSADQGGRPPWSADFSVATSRGRRRLHRVDLVVSLLRTLGILLLLWIAVGIPLATGRFGVYGLVRGIIQAFVIAIVMALLTMFGLRWLGAARPASIRAVLPLLSPFTAPRACELVLAAAIRDLDPLAKIAALYGEARFLIWIRPWAYDELHARGAATVPDPDAIAVLVERLPRLVLERAVQSAPGNEAGAHYCPRCARTYRDDILTCHDCDALSLVRS